LAKLLENQLAPLAALAHVGGFEHGMLAGLILSGAGQRVPMLFDSTGGLAAATLAWRLCPHAAGYLVCAQHLPDPSPAVLQELALPKPLLDVAVTAGGGAAVALALPIVEASVRLVTELAQLAVVPSTPGAC
jgi:nicotinate-nucleotide--dimethylbenzimidazole phosphoribosyltransferase